MMTDRISDVSQLIQIDSIQVGERHRRDLGDINELTESISAVGLLHPIVVTPDRKLIAGQRRIEACRRLGWSEIPVRVIHDAITARALLIAERDENTCRLDMKPSEKVALGRALEELERGCAAARKRATQAKPGQQVGQGSENFTAPIARGETREIVGGAVGMSGPTYQRAKAVVEASEDESLPSQIRNEAIEARKEMDQTGKVTPAYNRVAQPTGRKAHKHEGNGNGRFEPVTARQRQMANGQRERLIRAVSGIHGVCRGLRELKLSMAVSVCTAEELDGWAEMLGESARTLKDLRTQLIRINGHGD